MKYFIQAGTKVKLLSRVDVTTDEYDIKDWYVRMDCIYAEEGCGINPDMLANNPDAFNPDSLGVELAKDGYALFSSSDVKFDSGDRYIIAVPFGSVALT